MGLRDRLTDALGGAIGGALDIVSDSLEKANTARSEALALSETGKAQPLPPDPPAEDVKSLMVDPYALVDQLGYREKPGSLTYLTLRNMARKVPTFTAVEQTRITQVSAFGQRPEDDRDSGFEIVLRNDEDTMTKPDQKRANAIEDIILQTGTWWDPERDDFRSFLRKLVRDSLELDQACFEIQRDLKDRPTAFYAIDGATVRRADSLPQEPGQFDPEIVRYVQIYDEMVISEFGARDLCFGLRNPRTDIRANGYGYSELEMIIEVITASLWGFQYNKKQFSQGSLVHGILNFKGDVPDSKVDAFRRQWKMMIAGVQNAHKTPMTNVNDLQWIDFQRSNRDMEYSAWMDWLIKVTCAVMQFDPAEINFTYGNTGQASQMFGTNVDDKLKASKDRGLRPLLKDIANWLNVHIIWPLDPNFKLKFTGLDPKDEDKVLEHNKKRSEFIMTVDELRAQEDLDPLPDGQGEVILNSVWLQAKQGAEMGGMGMEGEEGEGEGEDESLGDVTELDQQQEQPDEPDFDQVFGETSEKSLQDADPLRKSRKVRVYEIEL